MEPEKIKLYFILLRLKSYLVSLLDNPDECSNDFDYTKEFLNRRYPEKLEEVIDILRGHGINSDCDIAFDQNIQAKFKAIVDEETSNIDLETMLTQLEIETKALLEKEKKIDKYKTEREEAIKRILASLFQLSKIWVAHKNLQVDIDNYSFLEEEEILRPEEIEELKRISVDSVLSFDVIAKLTMRYLDELSDFYFRFGGDINLKNFVNEVEKLGVDIEAKYENLFRQHGLNPDEITGNN